MKPDSEDDVDIPPEVSPRIASPPPPDQPEQDLKEDPRDDPFA